MIPADRCSGAEHRSHPGSTCVGIPAYVYLHTEGEKGTSHISDMTSTRVKMVIPITRSHTHMPIGRWSLSRCSLSRRSLSRWSLSRWSLSRWSLSRWSLSRWSLSRWSLSRWSLSRWSLSRWSLSRWSLGRCSPSRWSLEPQ